MHHERQAASGVSVVTPVHNEEQTLRRLVRAIEATFDALPVEYEIIVVDDGSNDGTAETLAALLDEHARLRALHVPAGPRARRHGQSAAFHAGFRATRFPILATLDGDLQNDPADLPALLEVLAEGADLVQGDRSGRRADGFLRRCASLVGRLARRGILGDRFRDSACSLRVMRRPVALALPLELRGMHRFVPFLAKRLGYRVVEVPVSHRPRSAGRSKYGLFERALPGLIDCLAVRWMVGRRRPAPPAVVEIEGARAAPDVVTRLAAQRAPRIALSTERRRTRP